MKIEYPPKPSELYFTPETRDLFMETCLREAIEKIEKADPASIKIPLTELDIRTMQETGLHIYERLVNVGKKRTYPAADVVHIFSGPFSADDRGMDFIPGTDQRANISRSRDYDRDWAGIAVAREIARANDGNIPHIVYNGQPSKMQNGKMYYENDAFRHLVERAIKLGGLDVNDIGKVHIWDTVENTEGEVVNIVHTGHQVRSFVQQCTSENGALHELYAEKIATGKPLEVAVVSHNSGIIRIPFYWGFWQNTMKHPQTSEQTIALDLYGVRDRSLDTGDRILSDELVRLALYASQGSLSPKPYPFTIPGEKSEG
jgi:hypothetical protein